MLDYSVGVGFTVMWKNCQIDEDCNGQRMLYSQSPDAENWSKAAVLFPNLTVPGGTPATLEPGPPIHINGRVYFAVSPGVHNTTHDSSAQGSQFCLWPDPLEPRNCGPPSDVAVQYSDTLLLREVRNSSLGRVFWASNHGPSLFATATARLNISTLAQMDAQTIRDVETLSATKDVASCAATDGTLKCEGCAGGCQVYSSIDFSLRIANERTHWEVPGEIDTDLIAYRSEDKYLYTSIRVNSTSQQDWQTLQRSNIPNDNSNLNAGVLPDGRVYLVHNPVVPANGECWARDPVTVAFSKDGYAFEDPAVVLTCTDMGANGTAACGPRVDGHGKNPGKLILSSTTD